MTWLLPTRGTLLASLLSLGSRTIFEEQSCIIFHAYCKMASSVASVEAWLDSSQSAFNELAFGSTETLIVDKDAQSISSALTGSTACGDLPDADDDDTNSESSEYTTVPSEYFEKITVAGRRMSKAFPDSWEFIDERAELSSMLQHHLWLLLNDGRLHNSPISRPTRVINIGAGFGHWSIDFADKNREVDVLAIDRLPILPALVPPNLTATYDDIFSGLPCREETCDLAYLRQVVWCVDYHYLFCQAFELLKPGAWIEFSWLALKHQTWESLASKIGDCTGRRFPTLEDVDDSLKQARFLNIKGSTRQAPAMGSPNALDIRGHILPPLLRGLGMNDAEAELLAVEVNRTLSLDMVEFCSVWAQKPLKA
ncbi:S-adenosyl-L-methionine-dependent methyltransferase [Thelonectria olida]|uniref:S-adenosyl-L-methionine-dependent methyltransferase n=1 Tax=Thelonectria olida TaxID=1576542 RepID=A0A9P8W4G0_9HYPO|nr:S-adenosyl-L-methionine-dependent methyltransferase [Thelonectria olida]